MTTVVIVEDEQAIAQLVCDVLAEEGIESMSCSDGALASAFIRQAQPRLVILDVQLPGCDGVDVFKQIRADPTTMAIPVIFFTANSYLLKRHFPDYAQHGAALLLKPFDSDRLLRLVQQTLEAHVG